jgi:hypothetical protein
MPATYTFDIFSTLDGYGSYGPDGDWGGYWGKQGPEFLDHRLALYISHPDAKYADNGGVDNARRTPRLARPNRRER